MSEDRIEATDAQPAASQASAAPVTLDRDVFLRDLIRELAGTLEEVVGLSEAEGYISVVGAAIGDKIDQQYRKTLSENAQLDRDQVADVLVDLKRRIEGDFFLVSIDKQKIVLGNRTCPFGDKVLGRPSMCMMTSNVFGRIAANNLGYARVSIDRSIARGDGQCRVVIYLDPKATPTHDEGREYFRVD